MMARAPAPITLHPDLSAVRWPEPANAAAAQRLIGHFGQQDTALHPLLAALGGNSPFLAERAAADPDLLRDIARMGPRAVIADAITALRGMDPAQPRAEISRALRQAKQRVALASAAGDIALLLPLAEVTAALSDLAEAALALAVRHLLLAARAEGRLRLAGGPDVARGCGFTVLAMGKLGARELNYSSDIDLVLLHDPDLHPYLDGGAGPLFARMARELTSLMSHVDEHGYVFRVDLRLRPDPASTPPSVSLPAALAYYESQGATWERAAMIKARPVAGDIAMGARFLAEIAPFVWRRHLDFAAIADIRAMKARIDAHKGTRLGPGRDPVAELCGHDLKLGQGGIREIEFCAQTLQLVWGGREQVLRKPGTIAALAALSGAGHLPPETAARLSASYTRLRQIEHRVQMVDDRQTHSLPASEAGMAAMACFLGEADAAVFAAGLHAQLRDVHDAFNAMFARLPAAPGAAPGGGGAASPPRRLTIPPAFARPEAVEAAIAAWAAGRPRALRTARARELAEPLLPGLLAALARQSEPDVAFARFDEMLWRLPAGVQILSMFAHNPDLLGRLADVLGAAPFLADHLAASPAALEGFLALGAAGAASGLRPALRGVRDIEEALGVAAPLIRGEEFRLALGEFDGRLSTDAAGVLRSELAEAGIAALLPVVWRDQQRRFGRIEGAMVVVALGKLGSREMLAGSDLDLMAIYDHPGDAESRGPKRLPASQYFGRAAQGLVAALTVPTRDGPLYAVDMRLRPSGNKGPVAVSLPAFVQYHDGSARLWELLALTRARVVAGPRALARRVREAMTAAINAAPPPAEVRAQTAAMRSLLAREHRAASPWDMKHRPGGLMELEFVAQALQLCAAGQPGARHSCTRIALARLARAGLLRPADARLLITADRRYRQTLGILRIAMGALPPARLPDPVQARLAALLGSADPQALLAETEAGVRDAFTRIIGPVDG